MSDNRVCEICSKRFSNGKAMGGHMRSHYAKFPLPPSKLKSDDQLSRSYENSCRSANRRPTAVTNYRERRGDGTEPKLRHKPVTKTPEHAETSDCLSIKDVALILVRIKNSTNVEAADKLEEERDHADDYSDEDDETFCVNRARSQGEYRCETCNKCFRSYQALGGHRASHTNSSYATAGVNRKIFQCPYCKRMFDSGQALGGHKKVHHLPNHNSGHANNDSVSVLTDNKSQIDLNFPVRPEEEEEDEVLSKFELSSESDDDDDEMVPRPINRRSVQFQ